MSSSHQSIPQHKTHLTQGDKKKTATGVLGWPPQYLQETRALYKNKHLHGDLSTRGDIETFDNRARAMTESREVPKCSKFLHTHTHPSEGKNLKK
ncbi:hypothetical protein CEXT_126861 [Caerostris extrusa]|uniref:Uncharacterized protein n=1 Tax=Caerostris extrusa TaxID=172846 RepID=A0AAV4XUZ7_CAEEX|nr:hypothetical protein CEXT_126861 [Caerostris extrusa]